MTGPTGSIELYEKRGPKYPRTLLIETPEPWKEGSGPIRSSRSQDVINTIPDYASGQEN